MSLGRTVSHLGDGTHKHKSGEVRGEYVDHKGEKWYEITGYDEMPPFFMSIVSPGNFWLFLSSNGGLTCGRVSCENSLFPYYTVDKIHDAKASTGPCTILQVTRNGKTSIWQPFCDLHSRLYTTKRRLYKTIAGDRVEFEECNQDLGLTFSYQWSPGEVCPKYCMQHRTKSDQRAVGGSAGGSSTSWAPARLSSDLLHMLVSVSSPMDCLAFISLLRQEFGFVRKCNITNVSGGDVQIRLLDGMQNILPSTFVEGSTLGGPNLAA